MWASCFIGRITRLPKNHYLTTRWASNGFLSPCQRLVAKGNRQHVYRNLAVLLAARSHATELADYEARNRRVWRPPPSRSVTLTCSIPNSLRFLTFFHGNPVRCLSLTLLPGELHADLLSQVQGFGLV